jgi:L,D-peptidoglycan transpeptidase YkuD (ErfK/YbiS/YcfS/YnhG family)
VALLRLGLAVLLVAACGAARGPIPRTTTRLVVVTTPGWEATTGELRRYERHGDLWQTVGAPVPVVVGHTGLAWGRGLHGDGAPTGRSGVVKREGDGRSPAGVFRLGQVYTTDADPPAGATVLTDAHRCVDDPAHADYNRIVDGPPTWKSAEVMRRPDGLYRFVVVVDHNVPAVPQAGSCIFLHVWGGPESPTVGCTAMPADSLAELIGWMDPSTVFVLLPTAEQVALRSAWRLP